MIAIVVRTVILVNQQRRSCTLLFFFGDSVEEELQQRGDEVGSLMMLSLERVEFRHLHVLCGQLRRR